MPLFVFLAALEQFAKVFWRHTSFSPGSDLLFPAFQIEILVRGVEHGLKVQFGREWAELRRVVGFAAGDYDRAVVLAFRRGNVDHCPRRHL